MRLFARRPALMAIVALITAFDARTAAGQSPAAQALPLIGSASAGTAFTRQCPPGQVLTGIRARAGSIIDALGIKCRPVNPNGSLGGESDVGSLAGGGGAAHSSGSCPMGSVIMGEGGTPTAPTGLSAFTFECRRWDADTRRWTGGAVAAIRVVAGSGVSGAVALVTGASSITPTTCARQTQPAVLLRGRAAAVIDAAGLTCNEP